MAQSIEERRAKHAAYVRRWAASNRERSRELARQSRNRYKEKRNKLRKERRHADLDFNAKQRAWRHANPHYRKAADRSNILSKHRRRALEGQFSDAEWQLVLWIYQYRCAYCRNMVPLCIDHVIPVSKGGDSFIENLVPACRGCNASKGNRDLDEWLARRDA
jgi:5-methylcytosine-specific restriction endonuclease McrA